MARISFEEFSAGLPVARVGEAPQPNQQTDTRQRGRVSFVDEAKLDRLQMGTDLQQTIDKTNQERKASRSRVESGEIGKAEGAFQIIGQGLLRGGEFLGKTAIGLAKMALPEPIEQRVRDTLGKDLQDVTSPESAEAFVKKLEQSKGGVLVSPEVDKAFAEDIRQFTEKYNTDPNFKANIDAGLGFAGTISSLVTGPAKQALTPDVPTPPSRGVLPVTAVDEGVQNIPIRTGVEATEETLSKYGEAPQQSAFGATVSGMARQVQDYAGRTINEAKDVAAREQRFASLPEPEANIRRVVADERVIDLVNDLSPEEIAVAQRLVDQAKLKQGDITPNTAHPKAIAGEELLKPVDFIINERKSVGANLGELRKQLDSKKSINTNSAFRNFHMYLKDNFGVQFDKQGNIISGAGTLARSDIPEVQKLYNEMRSKTFTSQRDIDEFLQRTLKDFDLRQAREQTFSDDVSRIAERARIEYRQLMPEQYNTLSTEYAQLSKPLTDIVKLLGYKGDLDALSTKNLKAGEVGSRILGNAADRPQTVIDDVSRVATEYGYNSGVNLNNIITLADQLESLYDITQPRSFTGQVSRGVDQSNTVGALGDMATMNVGGLYNRAAQSRATQAEIRQAFEDYINSLVTD